MAKLRDVPDSELDQAFRQCQVALMQHLSDGFTHAALAQRIGISESALKQFLRRGRADGPEGRRRGSAFQKIYLYVTEGPTSHEKEVQFSHFLEIDYDSQAYRDVRKQGYELILQMLAVDDFSVERYGRKLEGYYLCFRYSAIPDHIMISRLEIRKNEDDDWDFVHNHYDKFGELKESDGLFIPKNNSVYLIGDLERGAAIDILLFKEPISASFSYMAGIEMSVDNDFRPFTARILAFRCDSMNISEDFKSNEFIKRYCKAVKIDDLDQIKLFRSDSIYEEIRDRLKVGSDERIVRIEPR